MAGTGNEAVRYEERDTIAILTLCRPKKLNTLTESVIQGIADGIDAATASRDVRFPSGPCARSRHTVDR